MRKIIFSVIIFLGLTALSFNEAAAVVTLSLQPSTQRANVGESFIVDLVVSGLGDGVAPSIKAFDIDITFDVSVISFESVDFGPFLGDPSNLSETSINFTDASPDYVWLAETSLLSAPALHALQGASFTLATLEFTALTAGSTNINCDLYSLKDTAGSDLISAHGPVDSASVDVNIPVDGYIHHVREPGPVSKTYIEVVIGEDFEGSLPDDIGSISVEVTDSNGVTTPLTLPPYEYFDQWRDFFFVIDGPPVLGFYTFTVTSTPATGSLSGSDTDHQYTKIDIPIPGTATFSPADATTITSKTPSFSWDPVELPGVPLYYRLIIDDGTNRVYSTGRVFGMTSHTVPEGVLTPGQTYYWRVRVTDAADYDLLQNRASHVANADPAAGKLSFTMATSLTHKNKPFIFPDDWTTTTYSREYGNATLCWIRIKDHDGVASDGSSHHVEVTLPGGGGTHTMEHDRTDGPDVVAYSYWSDDPPQSGLYTFRVTDQDGNIGTLVENFNYDPLPLPDESSITPSVRNGQITASFDNIYVRKDGALELYEDFNSYSSIDDIDSHKWDWQANASIQRDNGNGWLLLDIGNSVGRANGTLNFADPQSINEIQADVTVTDINEIEGIPRARIRGTWCNNGIGDIGASLSINGSRVFWSAGEEFINGQDTWQWTDGQSGDLLTGLGVGDTVTLSISWDGTDLTFSVTGPSGSNSYTYTPANNLGPPIYPEKLLQTRIYLYTDTTPTFNWNPVVGAERYRVRIYNADNSQTIWSGYPGGTSVTVPPGILQPNSYYRFRLEAWDSPDPLAMSVDNVSKTPASNDDHYIFYTGSEEDDHPFIRLRSSGVEVWNNELLEPNLYFFVEVYDVDGVGPDSDPDNNIELVKVVFPDDTTEELLEYRSDFSCCPPTTTSSIYFKASSKAIQAGTYTFIVRDKDGNEFQKTEELTPDPIGYPLAASLRPLDGTVIGSTEVHLDWEDVEDAPGVPAAAFYWVQIYDQGFNRIYNFGTTESELHLAAGFLEEQTLYRWRVQTRREFFSENVDNGSSAPAEFYSIPTFVTTTLMDADGDLMPDDWENEHGLNTKKNDAAEDADGDGLTNLEEYQKGTDPNNSDTDNDGIPDGADSFPLSAHESADSDGDGVPDNTDPCPYDPDNDSDGDGVCGDDDNCPEVANGDQADLNGDNWGDVCDDIDGDLVNDDTDPWPIDPDDDLDNDGYGADPFENCLNIADNLTELAAICQAVDNCPGIANDQTDSDGDGVGDECDLAIGGAPPACHPIKNPCDAPIDDTPAEDDADGDTIPDAEDFCPNDPVGDDQVTDPVTGSINHLNTDGDGDGDACDADDDNDGVPDASDNCRLVHNTTQDDLDCDDLGDLCDTDRDGDGYSNSEEISTYGTYPDNADTDGDGVSDGSQIPIDCNNIYDPSITAANDPTPLGDPPQYSISFEVRNQSGADIKSTWLPTPEWNDAEQKWDPEIIRIRATLQDENGDAAAFSGDVTFEILETTNHEGVAANDEEEYLTAPLDDFSFNPTVSGDPLDRLQTFSIPGVTGKEVDLFAFDFGGRATVKVTTSVGGDLVAGEIKIPLDSDIDNLPDRWEQMHDGFNPFNANTFSAEKIDGDADIDTSANNSHDGDGLPNSREYRGIILDEVGTNGKIHKRLDPHKKDLFVRGDHFVNSLPPNASPDVLPFSVDHIGLYGSPSAFEEAGIVVHDVTGMPSFVDEADPFWEPPHLDILVVTNQTEPREDGLIETLLGVENGFINHPSSLIPRYWTWDLKGASYIGNAQYYAIFHDEATNVTKRGTETYHLTLMHYFYNRPYLEDTNNASSCNQGYTNKLDPLNNVEDYYKENGIDPPDSKGKNKEDRCIAENGVLDGDRMMPGWKIFSWGAQDFMAGLDLSTFDADADGRVENPIVDDPENLDPLAHDAAEYTAEQVQLHTIIHEMGHAVGMDEQHTSDPECLMYEESINWSRAGHFSPYSQSQILIHNKTELP